MNAAMQLKTLPKKIHLTWSFCKIRLSKWYFFKSVRQHNTQDFHTQEA